MDVEIVKQNGQSFRLSDYGVVQDFVVHSIDRSVVRDPIDGRAGSVDYGVETGDRTIEVPMIFKAADLHDYAHLRDELYSLLDDSEPFYIREMRRPKSLQYDFVDFGQKPKWESQTDNEYVNGKQYKVRLNNTLTPDQRSLSGEVSIEFVTSGLPYAETIYTTLELHDSGYSAIAEKYGLVDNIDDEKVKYRFEPQNVVNPNWIPLNEGDWETGSRWSSGYNNNTSTGIRLKMEKAIPIVDGRRYTLYDDSTYDSRINRYMVHCFDDEGNMTYYFSRGRGASNSFTAKGTKLVISLTAMDGYDIPLDYIEGDRIRMKLEEGDNHTGFEPSSETFTVYNAGNVTIEPESMMFNIIINAVQSPNNFTIRNKTTGEEIILKRESKGSHFIIRGMVVSLGSLTNIFRDTNRSFISLAPGNNQFEVLNGTFEEMRFEFKYLYK